MNGLTNLDPTQVSGHIFQMRRTDPRHVVGRFDDVVEAEQPQSFAQILTNALGEVNEAQQTHDQLSLQAVLDPASVDSHDVTIAAAEASMSLSLTKSVVDAVLQAYREIINMR